MLIALTSKPQMPRRVKSEPLNPYHRPPKGTILSSGYVQDTFIDDDDPNHEIWTQQDTQEWDPGFRASSPGRSDRILRSSTRRESPPPRIYDFSSQIIPQNDNGNDDDDDDDESNDKSNEGILSIISNEDDLRAALGMDGADALSHQTKTLCTDDESTTDGNGSENDLDPDRRVARRTSTIRRKISSKPSSPRKNSFRSGEAKSLENSTLLTKRRASPARMSPTIALSDLSDDSDSSRHSSPILYDMNPNKRMHRASSPLQGSSDDIAAVKSTLPWHQTRLGVNQLSDNTIKKFSQDSFLSDIRQRYRKYIENWEKQHRKNHPGRDFVPSFSKPKSSSYTLEKSPDYALQTQIFGDDHDEGYSKDELEAAMKIDNSVSMQNLQQQVLEHIHDWEMQNPNQKHPLRDYRGFLYRPPRPPRPESQASFQEAMAHLRLHH